MLGVEPNYLLYTKVSLHLTPAHNGAAMLPVKYPLQRGYGGSSYDLWEPPLMG